MNYKAGLKIARLSLTGRISRQGILKITDCVCYQHIRFVTFWCSTFCHGCSFSFLYWKRLGGRMGSVFVLLMKSHLFMKEWNSSSSDLSYYSSLPLSMQWGYVVITTPDGVLDHEEAIKKNVGGQVLGYFL